MQGLCILSLLLRCHMWITKTKRTYQTKQKKQGRHAMVIIGTHEKKDEKKTFLLQNWRKRQLIEVSAEYLSKVGATVVFIKKEVKEIPKEFPKDNASYMETEDLGEQLLAESKQIHFNFPPLSPFNSDASLFSPKNLSYIVK